MSFIHKQVNRGLKRLGLQLYSLPEMKKAFNSFLGGWRAPRELSGYQGISNIVEPPWDYVSLVRLWDSHPILGRIGEAIARECFKKGGGVKPLFAKKCRRCGHEYQEATVEECTEEGCGGELRRPEPSQRRTLETFIANPNRDEEWTEIQKSLLRYTLCVDDWYVSKRRVRAKLSPELEMAPLVIFVEDSRYIRICEDKRTGLIGMGEYFCPDCYDREKDTHYTREQYEKYGHECPLCNGELEDTAYIWREGEGTTVKGRWSRREMIHGHAHPQLPHHYGISPLIKVLSSALFVRRVLAYKLEDAARGKISQLLIFSGISQDQANKAHADIGNQVYDKIETSTVTGQHAPPRLYTPFIGLEDPNSKVAAIPAMPEDRRIQQLDWTREQIEWICAEYGVTPTFKGIAQAGAGGVLERIDVDDDVVLAIQTMFEDKFRENLWLELGVTDWEWRFNPIIQSDRLLDARINQLNVDTVIKAVNAGMTGEIEEDGTLKVFGKPEKQEFKPFGGESTAMPKPELTNPEESPIKLSKDRR